MKRKNARATEIAQRLDRMYPEATVSLDYRNAYELLIATILAAQSTDQRINAVTPGLFRHYPTPADLASADLAELEEEIRSTGFYRNKAKAIRGAALAIVERHGGQVPETMEELTALPGVGRKTANVVLGNAFGRNDGIVVDTHMKRVCGRLALTHETDPEAIESDLMRILPRDRWTSFAHRIIIHGRTICVARKPRCSECDLSAICPSAALPTAGKNEP